MTRRELIVWCEMQVNRRDHDLKGLRELVKSEQVTHRYAVLRLDELTREHQIYSGLVTELLRPTTVREDPNVDLSHLEA